MPPCRTYLDTVKECNLEIARRRGVLHPHPSQTHRRESMTKYRNTLLLAGLWVNAYIVGLERAEGLTWRVWLLVSVSATYLIALINAWPMSSEKDIL
jgi:hypothetical protein